MDMRDVRTMAVSIDIAEKSRHASRLSAAVQSADDARADTRIHRWYMINRRGLLTGLIALGVTAPAIIRPGVLMPVRVIRPTLIKTNFRIVTCISGNAPVGKVAQIVTAYSEACGAFSLVVTPVNGELRVGDLVIVDDDGRAYA